MRSKADLTKYAVREGLASLDARGAPEPELKNHRNQTAGTKAEKEEICKTSNADGKVAVLLHQEIYSP